MAEDIELVLSEDERIPGTHPIVFIGPNGSGKTRLGARLAQSNNAQWIGALRNLELPDDIPMRNADEASREVGNQVQRSRSHPWRLAQELNALVAKLLAEDAHSAITYRNESRKRPGGQPPETKVMKLIDFWQFHFPNRTIDLSTYKPTAISDLGASGAPYPASQMSDGERVALYLSARVIDTSPGLILIDEPEVHFHSVLARRFWNGLEEMRPDCRFVYITHDIPFTLSRRAAQFVVVRRNEEAEVLPHKTDIPSEIIQSILGAASFSVTAKRIVFCEGVKQGERDESFYSAWFQDDETAVIPVGGCYEVEKCVEVFNSGKAIKGASAIGIIDRDYWPDDYLDNLPAEIHVLNVHEVESLLCLPKVFKAVAKYLQIQPAEISTKYNSFLAKAKGYFKDASYNKQILERSKIRAEFNTAKLLNKVSSDNDLSKVQSDFLAAFNQNNWNFDPGKLFDEERTVIDAALSGGPEAFLKVLPGKSYFSHAMQELGVDLDRFMDIVVAALRVPDGEEKKHKLGPAKEQLVAALEGYLPPRRTAAG